LTDAAFHIGGRLPNRPTGRLVSRR
jgi:hypothetical protein